MAIADAQEAVGRTGDLPVPLHLRNAPTKLMADLGYHEGYKYAHDYAGNYVEQQYLPDAIIGAEFWKAGNNPSEYKMQQRLDSLKGENGETK